MSTTNIENIKNAITECLQRCDDIAFLDFLYQLLLTECRE